MKSDTFGALVITHYERLLDYIKPDIVHVLMNGQVVRTGGNELIEKINSSKADTIASRTAKYITESMDTDPAFFKKFSKMLKDTIEEYRQGRISEAEYLQRAEEIMHKVLSHTDSEIPVALQNNNAGRAYFGLGLEAYKRVCKGAEGFDLTNLALMNQQ